MCFPWGFPVLSVTLCCLDERRAICVYERWNWFRGRAGGEGKGWSSPSLCHVYTNTYAFASSRHFLHLRFLKIRTQRPGPYNVYVYKRIDSQFKIRSNKTKKLLAHASTQFSFCDYVSIYRYRSFLFFCIYFSGAVCVLGTRGTLASPSTRLTYVRTSNSTSQSRGANAST